MARLIDYLRGRSKNTWQPTVGADTTTSSYWMNWRFLLCCLLILISMVMALYLIMKYERPSNRRTRNREEEEGDDGDYGVVVYDEEVWKPCMKGIHPTWLMALRVFAFSLLLLIIILNTIAQKGTTFYFYTEWTFILIIIYFGLGSLLSMYGCYHHDNGLEDRRHPRQVAGVWGYIFQIVFQTVAGAILLTDCLFWFIIVPTLVRKDQFDWNILTITLHSINVVFLLCDTALNSMRFPLFRIAYFVLWTCVFVVFQWILHACIPLWCPYTFLDLSSKLSPLWYLLVALLHFPCYGVFFLVIKLKNYLLLKVFLRDG